MPLWFSPPFNLAPPFAFGAVHPWAFAGAEIHIALLVILWMFRLLVSGQPLMTRPSTRHRSATWYTLLPLLCFMALLSVQLLPMSPDLLYYLSRSTYDLYRLFHPNWPHTPVMLSLNPYASTLGLMKALAYIGLFAFAVDHLRTERHIRQAIWTIILTAAITALLGICQHFAGLSAIYGWRDASYAHFFGPFINRNHFAAYQSSAILIGFGLLVTDMLRKQYQETRLLIWFALATMTGALCLTLSRAGVLSFLAGLILFGLLHRRHRKRSGRSWLWVLGGLALMCVWLGLGPLVERFSQSFSGETATWGDRGAIYAAAWTMFKAFPIFGIGLGAFPAIFPRYQPEVITLRYLQAHSDVLQLLVETGLVGLIACATTAFGLVASMVKPWRQSHCELTFGIVPAGLAAIAATILHACVDFSLRIPANAMLLAVVLAITKRCAVLPPRRCTSRACQPKGETPCGLSRCNHLSCPGD